MRNTNPFFLTSLIFIFLLSAQLCAQSSATTGSENKSKRSALPGGYSSDPEESREKSDTTEDKTRSDEEKASEKAAEAEKKEKERAARQLELDKKGSEFIKRTLKFGTQKERAQAIKDYKRIKDESLKKELLSIIIKNMKTEENTSVLLNSIHLCKDEKATSAIPAIAKALDHDDRDVKVAAVYTLREFKADSQKEKLVEELKKQDFTENSTYTEALLVTISDFGDLGLYDFIKEKIDDPETTEFHRTKLILFLGDSKTTAAKVFLLELMKDEDENATIRSYAVSSLSKLEDTTVTPDIKAIADEIEAYPFKKKQKYNSLYIHCITALVRLGDPSAYETLEASLKSNNATVRLRSIRLMKELGDKRSIDILRYKAQYDQNGKVQKAAKDALKEAFDIDLDAEKEKEKNKEDSKNTESAGETAEESTTQE